MGFNFRQFVSGVGHHLKRFGSSVNRTFNTVKHHAKRVLPTVKRIAGQIREGVRQYSTLPGVGNAMSTIGQVADVVHRGADTAERFFNHADRFQTGMGLDTSLRI